MCEACNHVTALLYRLDDAVRKGLNVGTAHTSQWTQPSSKTTVDSTRTLEDALVDWQRITYEAQGKYVQFSACVHDVSAHVDLYSYLGMTELARFIELSCLGLPPVFSEIVS